MDAKDEMINRIAALGESLIELKDRIAEVVNDYSITRPAQIVPVDLESHIQRFIAAKRIDGLSPKTLDNYNRYLHQFARYVCKNADKIETDDIRSYIGSLSVGDNSLLTITNILRSFFSWLTVEEVILKNPMLRIRSARKRHSTLRKFLTCEELERLRNACQTPRERALVEFLYSSGCRVSEVVNLRLSDIDFASRLARVTGKGNKERLVCFSIKTKLLLQVYLDQRAGRSNALFATSRTPVSPLGVRTIQKTIQSLGDRAGLSTRVHPHLLRHTFATLSLNNGMDITVIQRLLGHSQLSTTEIYATASLGYIQQSYDRTVI